MAKDNFGKGIDVSHWQKEINWQKVKEYGISFAIAKVTGGSNFQDPKFLVNWAGMKNNGIKGSAYHYLKGDQLPEAQITNIKEALIAKCDFDVGNDILAIDVEEGLNNKVSPDQMADTLWGVVTGLNKTFSNIYIYCSPNYWETKVQWQKYNFSLYKLWIAHWTEKDVPKIPATWQDKGWVWWQYSSKGKVEGIIGDVDLDRSNLSGIVEAYQES